MTKLAIIKYNKNVINIVNIFTCFEYNISDRIYTIIAKTFKKKGGLLMKNDFASETSKLAWDLFKETGEIGFYMLYRNIENPPKILETESYKDDGRGM